MSVHCNENFVDAISQSNRMNNMREKGVEKGRKDNNRVSDKEREQCNTELSKEA